MMLLMSFLVGLVHGLAVLFVGLAGVLIVRERGLRSLMAGATGDRGGRRDGHRGAGHDERDCRGQKHFLKHAVTPLNDYATLRGPIRPQQEKFVNPELPVRETPLPFGCSADARWNCCSLSAEAAREERDVAPAKV